MNVTNSKATADRILSEAKVQQNIQRQSKRISIAESLRTKNGKAPLNLEVKAALATCLENTRQICEATQSSAIPSKTFFMDMVAAVVPNLIAPEIVSVQAMDAKAGMISYLRFVYGSDKGATAAGTMFNNSLYHGISDVNYSSSIVEDEGLTAGSGATLTYYPVVPGTVTVTVNGVTTTDNGAGTIGAGTINYATGTITGLTFVAGDTAKYEYDNETAPVKVPQISLDLAQVPVFAKSRKLAAYWGFDAAYDLKKQYGSDVETLMATQAAGEIGYKLFVA